MDFHNSFALIHNFALVFIFLLLINTPCKAQLSSTFYDDTCPTAVTTITTSITNAVSQDITMAASLIRLHFHDCFVQGCDASIMLNDPATTERTRFSNAAVRGYEVIDAAKSLLENICPGVVSCADILAVAARDASVAVNGPSWTVSLGRRDSTTSNPTQADSDLPRADQDLASLISLFRTKGLSERDMVALSGAHTIGRARCVTFRARIYNNDSAIDPDFANTRRSNCPPTAGDGDNTLAPLDLVTPNSFDNNYFSNLLQRRGLLQSDQLLFSGVSTDSVVTEYSNDPSTFSSDFVDAMVRMGAIDPLTGTNGIIRTLCSAPNQQIFGHSSQM